MRTISTTVTVLMLAASATCLADENCKLNAPPRDAAVNVDHGIFFFIYPRVFGKAYTGCQTMWDEKGDKVLIAEFRSGTPTRMTIVEHRAIPKTLKCVYRDEKLAQGPKDACWEFDALREGIPSISKETEPAVPRDRDPRL